MQCTGQQDTRRTGIFQGIDVLPVTDPAGSEQAGGGRPAPPFAQEFQVRSGLTANAFEIHQDKVLRDTRIVGTDTGRVTGPGVVAVDRQYAAGRQRCAAVPAFRADDATQAFVLFVQGQRAGIGEATVQPDFQLRKFRPDRAKQSAVMSLPEDCIEIGNVQPGKAPLFDKTLGQGDGIAGLTKRGVERAVAASLTLVRMHGLAFEQIDDRNKDQGV